MNKTESSATPHIAIIVTCAMSTGLFRGQFTRLRQAGFRVTFICSPGVQTREAASEGAEVITVPMERAIAPLQDLKSLWNLWRTLRLLRPDIVNVGTPKAGLLGGLATRLACPSRRVYTLHGLRFETARGWKRGLLKFLESIACRNAQYVRCVSPSLRDRAIQYGVLDGKKAYVVGAGSANGIDCEHYICTPRNLLRGRELRKSLGIPDSAAVVGFVGRFTQDKGFAELHQAYVQLKQTQSDLHLLLVGIFEDGDPVDSGMRRQLESDPNVHFTGLVADVAPYYHAMDILAFPTHREGLGMVSLEAQASGVPVVATTATGAVDSVRDGCTGKLIPPRDAAALAAALEELLTDRTQRQRLGIAASAWVRQKFQRELIWDALVDDYRNILRTMNHCSGPSV